MTSAQERRCDVRWAAADAGKHLHLKGLRSPLLKSSHAPTAAVKSIFARLMDLALRGERNAKIALERDSALLGIGIANLIQGLAPEAVIVGVLSPAYGRS